MDAAIEPTRTATYSPVTAQFLSTMVGLAYAQFDAQWPDGQIPADQLPAGYTQIAAFQVPELDLDAAQRQFLARNPDLVPLTQPGAYAALDAAARANLHLRLATALAQFATLSQVPIATGSGSPPTVSSVPEWFGFALAPNRGISGASNIIALRGTRTVDEWTLDATAFQVPIPLVWFDNHDQLAFARVHLGFLILFEFMKAQLDAAFGKLNASAGTLVAGHSLGSALATLTAVYTQVVGTGELVEMYNLASPRVGDPEFVGAFNSLVPHAFRIVNLSDLVPMLPPTEITLPAEGTVTYEHVGQEWAYLWQTGNVADNHYFDSNYAVAVKNQSPTHGQCTYRNYGC